MAQGHPSARPVYWPEIRTLMLASMAYFTFTIVIGILNGTDLVDFDHKRLLGHVHGGTLGWLTLSVFAASLWLFGGTGEAARRWQRMPQLVWTAIVVLGSYVLAFTFTYGWIRPILGSLTTLVIVAIFVWIASRAHQVTLGVPHLGFLAAVATSMVGGVLGVLWAIQITTGEQILPTGGEDAHPAVMVVGFLFPVALAMSEWAFSFPTPAPATRLGTIQMVFPFAGGILLMLSLLLDVDALAPVAILLEIVGVIIFLTRMWPNLRRVRITEPSPARWALLSVVGSLFVIGLAQFLVVKHDGDFDLVPVNQILALDHSQFIASMTAAVFAMFVAATAGRIGRQVAHVVFALVALGVTVFVAGLLADSTALKRIGAPTMGTGLLIGLVTFAIALLGSERATGPRSA